MAVISPSIILEFAKTAQEYMRKVLGVTIAIEEESLAYADHYIASLRMQSLPTEENFLLVATTLGAYFGEVVLHKLPGKWVGIDPSETTPTYTSWRIMLDDVPVSFSPIGIAAAALGHNDSQYDAGFTTVSKFALDLDTSLSRIPPVPEEYFYSLTGRYETLLYVIELLAQLLQKKEALL